MYKTTSSSLLRAASSRSTLLSSRSSLTQSSSPSAASASPSPSSSLLGRRSFATSSPAFRSLPRWSHCLHSRPSPFRLSSQIRAVSPGLDRLERNFSSMASEHPFKGIFTTLPKPGGGEFGKFYSLPALNDPRIDKLPYSIRILLESAIRNCDNFQVTKGDVEKIIDWEKTAPKQVEIPFKPARVLLQDFTGVPAVVDLACMRDAMNKLGSDSNKINPLVPVDLVIDHSVQVDVARSENAVQANMELEFQRNKERFAFLKWGSTAFQNMLVVPPGSGIVHQTVHIPSGEKLSVFDAAMRYKSSGEDTIILAGAEYGSGSSRDWAAKGPMLQGVKAVIAKSFERIHRSNLVGMGIIPLCFKSGEDADTLGLTGHERYTIHLPTDISEIRPGQDVTVTTDNGKSFTCTVRFDTEVELAYFNHGGILPYVIRNLSKQ
ncbi:hypothetical protein BRARA_C04047 [Brassica rapa]|uniref:Aconitase A/isopropylmalate dehydratase small subunit swivel domain-containing protein n=1 Tax=Brassica campestris TaxID=3711 RepID=A0A398A2X0_BRACM|nr:hypothetical protein BRARA_C04047 [Brassica rapa]